MESIACILTCASRSPLGGKVKMESIACILTGHLSIAATFGGPRVTIIDWFHCCSVILLLVHYSTE